MGLAGGLRLKCRSSTAIGLTLVALSVFAGSPAYAADECGPVPVGGGTIECPATNYPSGITYEAGVEDLTVVVDPGATLEDTFDLSGDQGLAAILNGVTVGTTGDGKAGLVVNSLAGDLTIAVDDVSTSGMSAEGIRASGGTISVTNGDKGGGGSITTAGDFSDGIHAEAQAGIDVQSALISTAGDQSDAIDLATISGQVVVRSNDIKTAGSHSDGIHAVAQTGGISIYNGIEGSTGQIETFGDWSAAIAAYAPEGDITVVSDSIKTHGSYGYGVIVNSGSGSINIASDQIETFGDYGMAIHANGGSGPMTISSNSIQTAGRFGYGIRATSSSGGGTIDSGDIVTSGDSGIGIFATSVGGDLSIKSGSITTYGGAAYLGYHYTDYYGYHIKLLEHGPGSSGIVAANYHGSVNVESGSIKTFGDYSYGIIASALDDVTVISGSIETHGSDIPYLEYNGAYIYYGGASGLLARSLYGAVNVKSDSITTFGDYSFGLVAQSFDGEANVDSGSIETFGNSAFGLYVQSGSYFTQFSPGGNTLGSTVTVDTIRTHGDLSGGMAVIVRGGDANVSANSIETRGNFSGGVAVTSIAYFNPNSNEFHSGDTNARLGSVITQGNYSPGVYAESLGGNINLGIGSISTSGDLSPGVIAQTIRQFDPVDQTFATGDVNLHLDSASTSGNSSSAVIGASVGGGVSIDTGSVETAGDFAAGVYAGSQHSLNYFNFDGTISGNGIEYGGDVALSADEVETRGDHSFGLAASNDFGDVNVTAGSVITAGSDSVGVFASVDKTYNYVNGQTYFGNVAVSVDSVRTTGTGSAALVVLSHAGDASVNAGAVYTSGASSAGIVVGASAPQTNPYTQSGPVVYGSSLDVAVESVTTEGNASAGVSATNALGGDVAIDAGDITTAGNNSAGIDVVISGPAGFGGSATISVDTVTSTGADADGVRAVSTIGGVTIVGGSIQVEGSRSNAIVAASQSGGSVNVDVLDLAVAASGSGIVASAGNAVNIDVETGARVFGSVAGIVANAQAIGSATTITNFGEIATGGGGVAIWATGQAATIDNLGQVTGPVVLTESDDLFKNSGSWTLFGNSDFGAGGDVVDNRGSLFAVAAKPAATITVRGLEAFNNSGLVSLADGLVGQTLDLGSASFNGLDVLAAPSLLTPAGATSTQAGSSGSTLAVDIGTAPNGALISDKLVVGAATGHTIVETFGIGGFGWAEFVQATSSTSADNFILSPSSERRGFADFRLDYDSALSRWLLVSSPDSAVFETSRLPSSAEDLWQHAADAWSEEMRDRDPDRAGIRLWGRFLQGRDKFGSGGAFQLDSGTFHPDLSATGDSQNYGIGADLTRGPWTWGVLTGEGRNDVRFTMNDDKVAMHGQNFGAFGTVNMNRLSVGLLGQYQSLRGHADLDSAGFSEGLRGGVFGLVGQGRLSIPLGSATIEPSAELSWSRGHLDRLISSEATVDPRRFTSLRGRLGARVSATIAKSGVTFRPFAGLYVADRFSARSAVDFHTASQSLALHDRTQRAYAEANGGVIVDAGTFRLAATGTVDFLGDHRAIAGTIGISWRH